MTTRNARASLWATILLLAAVAVAAVIVISQGRALTAADEAGPPGAAPSPDVVADDTRFLTDPPEAEVTVVEFLDFECEACGAFYPYVEELREKYGDRVAFAIRYFPLPGHANAENAALAVEAAAQQGALEGMYQRLYETQSEWGELQESRASLFREYAGDLGLDLAEYDRAIADPASLNRIRADFDAGRQLEVQQTPTFFVDGTPVELTAFNDLERSIAAALEE